jgi:hypothetical protein
MFDIEPKAYTTKGIQVEVYKNCRNLYLFFGPSKNEEFLYKIFGAPVHFRRKWEARVLKGWKKYAFDI